MVIVIVYLVIVIVIVYLVMVIVKVLVSRQKQCHPKSEGHIQHQHMYNGH